MSNRGSSKTQICRLLFILQRPFNVYTGTLKFKPYNLISIPDKMFYSTQFNAGKFWDSDSKKILKLEGHLFDHCLALIDKMC